MSKLPLSVGFMPLETRRDIILHVALKAEALGYESFVMPETWSYDMMVLLTEIATRTTRWEASPDPQKCQLLTQKPLSQIPKLW